jgi:hypothetical protein
MPIKEFVSNSKNLFQLGDLNWTEIKSKKNK